MGIISKILIGFALCLFPFTVAPTAHAEPPALVLDLKDIPPDGLVVKEISLQGLRRQLAGVEASRISSVVTQSGRELPSQWVPDPDFNGRDNLQGILLLPLPGRSAANLQLSVRVLPQAATALEGSKWVKSSEAAFRFDAATSIFPVALQFNGEGAVLEHMEWNTRIYNREEDSYFLRYDRAPRLKVMSDGAVATVVRGWSKYYSPSGKLAPGGPWAVIDWHFFKKQPLVYAVVRQGAAVMLSAHYWSENHMFELNFKGNAFKTYSSDIAPQGFALEGKGGSWSYNRWASLGNSNHSVAMLGTKGISYDGGSDYGTYMQIMEPGGWEDWGGEAQKTASWLRFSNRQADSAALETANQSRLVQTKLAVQVSGARARAQKLRAAIAKWPAARRDAANWRIEVEEGLVNRGWLAPEEMQLAASASLKFVRSGNMGLAFFLRKDGFQLVSAYDFVARQELLSQQNVPLLNATLRKGKATANTSIDSVSGWQACKFSETGQGFSIDLTRALGGGQALKATITARKDAVNSAWSWDLKLQNQTRDWSIDKVTFPQAAMADWGQDMKLFVPYAAGWVRDNLFSTRWEFKGDYPSNAAMQYMAAYRDNGRPTGLYFGRYDATATSKDIYAGTDPALRHVVMGYPQVAENTTLPGNTFKYQGSSYWRLLHGDWFDAAKIYRQWVKTRAPWWPGMSDGGRTNTPEWMKKIDLWINSGGENKVAQGTVEQVQKLVGEPVGAHWYAWPQIPFDNDYPHYFPAKEGFKETVGALQMNKVFVMPYINARLWDTRDRGIEDWQYTAKALPWTTKISAEGGLKVQTEESFPKETDGKTVNFGVMCPHTKFWQNTIADISDKLANDVGVKGIYIDQIAAGSPIMCMDPTHGHPLGGGHWWVDGYNDMLKQIRSRIPKDVVLTSECNAEPYMKYFDGYLVWNWQFNGMVPAYPAVYAGAVQMFGRNYAYTGDDIDSGLRMKASQSLVYGEQMGWMPADLILNIANEKSRQYFFDLIKTRNRYQKFLYAGEMARPPKLSAGLPTITADWQWSGQDKKTSPVIYAGAWKRPQDKKAILIFANAGESSVSMPFKLEPSLYSIPAKKYSVRQAIGAKVGAARTVSGNQALTLEIPGLSTLVVELGSSQAGEK